MNNNRSFSGPSNWLSNPLKMIARPTPVIKGLEALHGETNLIYDADFIGRVVVEMKKYGFSFCEQSNTQDFAIMKTIINAIAKIKRIGWADWNAQTICGSKLREIICSLTTN